jgi:hypothetical protein
LLFGWREPLHESRIKSETNRIWVPLMIIELAPLIFGTAALLAVFLFFSVAEH